MKNCQGEKPFLIYSATISKLFNLILMFSSAEYVRSMIKKFSFKPANHTKIIAHDITIKTWPQEIYTS